jgi:hypothetical protein
MGQDRGAKRSNDFDGPDGCDAISVVEAGEAMRGCEADHVLRGQLWRRDG